MKTSALIGPALDWAVAKCEGKTLVFFDEYFIRNGIASGKSQGRVNSMLDFQPLKGKWCWLNSLGGGVAIYDYSTNWSQGGPIIERENITLIRANSQYIEGKCVPLWFAETDKWVGHNITTGYEGEYFDPCFMVDEAGGCYGSTPLIAAMRAFVTKKFGDEVEIPEELR